MPVGNVSVAATFADLKFDGTKETAGRIVVYNKNLSETRYVAQADWDKEKYQTKGGWIPVAIVFGQVGTHYYGVSLVNSGQLKYYDSQAFVDGYGSAQCGLVNPRVAVRRRVLDASEGGLPATAGRPFFLRLCLARAAGLVGGLRGQFFLQFQHLL